MAFWDNWFGGDVSDDEGEAIAKAVSPPSSPIGDTGQIHTGGWIISDDKLPALNGADRYRTFLNIIKDTSIASAGVRIFLNLISGAIWQAEAPEGLSDNEQAVADHIAESVQAMMGEHKTSWQSIVRRIAMFRFMGFALMEWTAHKRDDGSIGIATVSPRPQRTISRWDLDDQGDVVGVWQLDKNMREVYIPRERLIYAVDDILTESPEGVGLLRHLVRPSERLKAFEAIEQVGFENDLRGIPVAYGPYAEIQKDASLTAAQKLRYKKPMTDFVTGHIRNKRTGLLLDSEVYRDRGEGQAPSATRKWAVELLRGESNAFEAMDNAIVRVQFEMARILGMEHLMMGADGSGSLAMSKSKVGTFYLTLMTTQAELVETVERDWRNPICEMNGWPKHLWPDLACEEIRDEDIEQITSALEKVARAGAMLDPNDPVINEIRQIMGVSPAPEYIEPALDDPAIVPAPTREPKSLEKSARRWVYSKTKGSR